MLQEWLIVLVSTVLGILLGASFEAFRRFAFTNHPARGFWNLGDTHEILFAVSLPVPDSTEHTVYVPTGDSFAAGEVRALLRQLYGDLKVTFHRRYDSPVEDWNKNICLIGGGKSNLTTRFLLGALDPPIYGRDHEVSSHDRKGGILTATGETVLSPVFENGELVSDYGYVLRVPNPFYPRKKVFLIVGGYAHGTNGAAIWATDRWNLLTFWLDDRVRALLELLRVRPKTDGVEVTITVPALPRFSSAEIADVGEPH